MAVGGAAVAALAGTINAALLQGAFPNDYNTQVLIIIYAMVILGGQEPPRGDRRSVRRRGAPDRGFAPADADQRLDEQRTVGRLRGHTADPRCQDPTVAAVRGDSRRCCRIVAVHVIVAVTTTNGDLGYIWSASVERKLSRVFAAICWL